MPVLYLALGGIFGYLLSKAGATDPQMIANLFTFADLQLLWVICSAIVVGIIGVQALKRLSGTSLLRGHAIDFEPKPFRRGLVLGAALFGIGWGLTGACPGTALTMLGEGRVIALFPLLGILLGTFAYGWWQSRQTVTSSAAEANAAETN